MQSTVLLIGRDRLKDDVDGGATVTEAASPRTARTSLFLKSQQFPGARGIALMEYTGWLDAVSGGVAQTVEQVGGYLPRIALAAVVLLAGWLVAKLLRMISVRLISGLDRVWHRVLVRAGQEQLQARHPPARVIGEIIFWLIILFFLTVAAEILGLGAFVTWGGQLVTYLPMLAAGLLIILAGVILSTLVRQLVAAAARSAGVARGDLIGRAAQGLVLLTAIVVGADQIGIDVGFLAMLAGIVLGTTLGGAAIAFGLGSKTLVSNVIAAHQARQLYHIGDPVRICDVEGKIEEFTPTSVVLQTPEGRVVVPAKRFDSEISVRRSKESSGAAR